MVRRIVGGDRLASTSDGATYLYSAAGCVTNISVPSVSSVVSLSWNSRYQLAAAYTTGGLADPYQYAALGRRVATTSGGTTTCHVYDDNWQVLADLDASGRPLRSYTWGPGIDNLLAVTVHGEAAINTYYALTDYLGTVHALVDATGDIAESYEFDAWGNLLTVRDSSSAIIPQSALGNRYLFQGREYSWASGLYYFRARWYDPVTGRWLSNDPIGISGGLNQYVFCANNPVNMTDSFGLWNQGMFWRGVAGLGANVVGAAVGYAGAETGAGLALAVWCSANAGVQFGNIVNSFRDGNIPALAGAVSLVAEYGQIATGSNNRYVRGAANITDLAGPFILSGQIDWSRVSRSAVDLFGLPTTTFTRAAVDPTVAYPWVNVFQAADAGLLIWDQGSSIYNQIMNPNGNASDTCK